MCGGGGVRISILRMQAFTRWRRSSACSAWQEIDGLGSLGETLGFPGAVLLELTVSWASAPPHACPIPGPMWARSVSLAISCFWADVGSVYFLGYFRCLVAVGALSALCPWYTTAFPRPSLGTGHPADPWRPRSEFQKIEVFSSRFFGRILAIDGDLMLTERDEPPA